MSGQADASVVVRVVLDHLQHVRRLAAQRLVRGADVVAAVDRGCRAQPWPLAGAACASCWRSLAHDSAKPSLKMPPGRSVPRPVSEITDNGAIAARCGGRVGATNSCEMPGYEMPTMPDLAVRDPRLRGDRLDDVVAVGRLQRLEEVERAARAAGAADVHADRREAERATR